MASFLTVQALAQTLDSAQQVSTLLKYIQPSFEVADVFLQTLRVAAGSPATISTAPLNYICLVAVRAGTPVDVAIKADANNNPIYTGSPGVFYLRCWQTGVLLDYVQIQASQTTDVEVCLAGRRTAF